MTAFEGQRAFSETERGTRRTNCHFCGYLCAFEATVEDGRVVDLQPDPTRYPYDERILAGCRRWKMNLDMLDGSDRVNWPLRRKGERGSGEFERVSWDEALDDIAARLADLRERYGAGTLASMIGGPHTSFWPLHRFMTLFGSPNNMGIGQICWNPRIWMDVITFGWTVEADLGPATECVFLWGTNPAESDNSLFWRELLRIGKHTDIPLVVIDPRYTRTAAAADVWIAPRPGTDCTLALGLIHVIMEEGLVDEEFVHEWCHGFEELAKHVLPYTPEHVAEVCGITADEVRQAARLFGGARASALVSGRGIDQVGKGVAPTHRAICCLRAVTGNVDRPGSCVLADGSDFIPEAQLELTLDHLDELSALCLNTPYTPLQCYEGFAQVNALTEKQGRTLPVRYLTSAHPDLVLTAMETGEPYPVRALIVEATNPLVTYADTTRVHRALMGLDLIVVLDYYLSPTAQIADYVLPAAGAIERPTFQAHGGVANIAYGGPRAVDPYYERKTDYDIFRELACRLGQADEWPWETFEDAIEATLAPAGMSWEEYCVIGAYAGQGSYEKHLMPNADGSPRGFATTTGKIELASELLPRLGGDRLPEQKELPRLTTDELVREGAARGAAHLPLITGARKQPYNASMYLNNEEFRIRDAYPLVEMSEATAADLGLSEGDTVALSTNQGRALFRVGTTRMRDGLLAADYGWWHPEWAPGGKRLGGMWESNVNLLTRVCVEAGEAMIGTWAYNAVDCLIERSDDALSWQPGFTPDEAQPEAQG